MTDNSMQAISARLNTQDNRITADPIFQVRGRRRIYGMDPEYADNSVWIDTEGKVVEVPAPEDEDLPGEFEIKTGYIDVWDVLMVAFTEEGCKQHIRLNGHNYRQRYQEVAIYADSLWRCPEMIAIRKHLMQMQPCAEAGE